MTTGSRSTGSDPSSQSFIGVGYRKSWVGADGRVETVDGLKRVKWNSYSASVRSRLRPTNTWDVYSRYVGPPPIQPLWHDGVEVMGCSHAVSPDNNWPHLDNNDQLRLLNKLAHKVKDHEFNLGINLGEMKEFVPMVASNLTKIAKSFVALRHGDFATAARHLGANQKTWSSKTGKAKPLKATDISGRWLEMQYGWLPSLSDIYEGSKAFEALSQGPKKSVVRTSVFKGNRYNGSTTPSRNQAMVTAKITRYITYEMKEELSAPRQLGLADPLSIAWELTPLSFVVDWALPIGHYLEALGTIPFLKGRFLETTVRKFYGFDDIQWTQPPHSTWGPNWFMYVVPPFPQLDTFRATEVERVARYGISVPTPQFKGVKQILGNATRVMNAISLVHQAFAGKPTDNAILRANLGKWKSRKATRPGRPAGASKGKP
jgi:hypothetical protein